MPPLPCLLGRLDVGHAQSFGRYIRQLREERGLTQGELATRAGLAVDSVRRIERGQLSPSLKSVAKLAAGMEISLHSLFGGYGAPGSFLADRICDLLARRSAEDLLSARRVIVALLGT
jgi:transcriptional regulator with XRE-family HTH domain